MRAPLLVLLLAAGAPAQEPAPAGTPPDIVLVMADDLGREWLSCYGGRGIETPHLDALAARGTRMRGIYSMPICTPTRATLLTGQYPYRHGWVAHWDVPRWGAGLHFDPDHNPSFARELREAGYATAIAGKWQINDFRVQPEVLDAHGFDEWCMWTGYETRNPPSGERYWGPYVQTRDGRGVREGRFGDDVFLEFAVDFLARTRDRPSLVYLPLCLPHGPLVAPPNAPDAEGDRAKFVAMVQYVDHLMGELQAALEELGQAEDTVVLFTTDNGTAKGQLGRIGDLAVQGGKGKLNEAGTRVPLIAAGPGIPAWRTSAALCDFTDLFPTLLDLAGVAPDEELELDGHSLAPVLRGEADATARTVALTMWGGFARAYTSGVRARTEWAERALTDGRFKLYLADREPRRFYDLARDPGEQHDLGDPEDPAARKALRALLEAAAALPERDATPRYDPTPPQPWDTTDILDG